MRSAFGVKTRCLSRKFVKALSHAQSLRSFETQRAQRGIFFCRYGRKIHTGKPHTPAGEVFTSASKMHEV
jgi:hypothetical protein